MCSPPCMTQTTSHTPFDFTVGTTSGKKEVSKRKVLAAYKDYLKKRIKETLPSTRMGNRLFEEIKAKGYRGSFSTVRQFLWVIRKETKAPQQREASIPFHKEYLIKRVKDASPDFVSGKQLLEEIRARGYRGSASTCRMFLSAIRKQEKRTRERSLDFHKDYLIKRIKDASPDFVSGKELFEEIRNRGYRGSASTCRMFLSAFRKQEKKPSEDLSNASVEFYKDYLTKRLEETYPSFVPGTELFKEIRDKGYRGSISTFQMFLSTLRKQEKKPSKDLNSASVEFYKDYLTKRLEKTYPSFVSGTELFKEIRDKGYRGSLSTFRAFLSTLRKQEKKPSEACLEFHKEYLSKRLKDTYPKYASGTELFKEIRAKGYRGSLSTCRMFLSTVRKQEKKPSEASCVKFHKGYLSKRLKETYPRVVSVTQLFKEIRAKGYQGSLSTLRRFLPALRRNYSISEPYKNDLTKQLDRGSLVQRNVLPEASLQFHKDYLIKRLQNTWPNCLPPKQLFEDIISRGYRGTCKEVEVFLMMIFK